MFPSKSLDLINPLPQIDNCILSSPLFSFSLSDLTSAYFHLAPLLFGLSASVAVSVSASASV